MIIDLTHIENILILFSLCLTLLSISTLIYFRYKYFIQKTWLYGNILFNITLLFLIYQFPYVYVQISLIVALIALYIIILTMSKDIIEINIEDDMISDYISDDLEYNPSLYQPQSSPLMNKLYYTKYSPMVIPIYSK